MVKVNYLKKWDETSTAYTQTIAVDAKEFLELSRFLHNVPEKERTFYYRHLADTPKKYTGKATIYYLNLTQLRFVAMFFKNNKRIKIDRNTILLYRY